MTRSEVNIGNSIIAAPFNGFDQTKTKFLMLYLHPLLHFHRIIGCKISRWRMRIGSGIFLEFISQLFQRRQLIQRTVFCIDPRGEGLFLLAIAPCGTGIAKVGIFTGYLLNKAARLIAHQTTKTITTIGIGNPQPFFGTGYRYIKQTTLFFQPLTIVQTHGARKQIFL